MFDRFERVLNRPVVRLPEDDVTLPDPNCGVKGVRCTDYPCGDYEPTPNATFIGLRITAPGTGSCDSDGHYLCDDCVHLSGKSIEWRQQ